MERLKMCRWARGVMGLLVAFSLLGVGDAYFLMGKLSWKQANASESQAAEGIAIEFRVDTVWAIDNVGTGLSGRDDYRAEIRSEWAAAVQRGPGALLPVPVTSILLGDGTSLPGQGDLLRLNITRVDSETVHASLTIAHTYNASSSQGSMRMNVSFEGCCRAPWVLNNPGMPFRLSTEVEIDDMDNLVLKSSPVVATHPIVRLRGTEDGSSSHPLGTEQFSIAASSGPRGSLEFRLATAGEMGEGVEAGQPVFSLPQGITLSSDGTVTVQTSLSLCPQLQGSRCVRQLPVIVSSGNSTSSALDFLIEVVGADTNLHAPVADFSVFLTTPATSAENPAQIDCRNGQVALPSHSAYLVSQCIDLADAASFPCGSYLGICPPVSYVAVPPFNGPMFISCFSQSACSPGLHRLYCTSTSRQSAAESSLRMSFRDQDSGQALARIAPSETPPDGVVLSPLCEVAGDCIGGTVESASTKFVDISWTPDCDTQLGPFIFCFVAIDEPANPTDGFVSLASKPSCIYVEAVNDIGAAYVWRLPGGPIGGVGVASQAGLPASTGPPGGTSIRLVMYRTPSHSVAEEAMIVQPQVACVDEMGNLVTLTQKAFLSVSLSQMSSGAVLGGNTVADVVAGIATFTDLAISAEGQGFTLRLQASSLGGNATVESPRFSILPPVRALRFAGGFPNVTMAGSQIGTFEVNTGTPIAVPTVYLLDSDHHYAALSRKLVTVSLEGAQVFGQTSVYASSGVAAFENIYITQAGNFSLKFDCGGYHIMSSYFVVSAGQATFLSIDRQPCAIPCDPTIENTLLQVAEDNFEVKLSLRDKYFNRITDQSASTSANLRGYPLLPVDSGLLSGCSDQSMIDGVAHFTDCSVGHQGFFKLEFTAVVNSNNLTLRNSTLVFDVQVAVRTLNFIAQPNTSVAGLPLVGGTTSNSAPALELLDEYGYRTLSRRQVLIYLNTTYMETTCASACLNASLCRSSKNSTCASPFSLARGTVYAPLDGVAVLADTVAEVASKRYFLNVISSETLFISSVEFEVTHASMAAIVVSQLPQDALLSEPFTLQPLVSLVDQFGNIVLSDSSGFVNCSLYDSDGFVLRGFSKARLSTGDARFINLAIDVQGGYENYHGSWRQLAFSSYGFSAVSERFYVADGVRGIEIIEQPPNNVTAGEVVSGPLGVHPEIRVLGLSGDQTNLSARAVGVRVNDSECPNRYPALPGVSPTLYQAKLVGVLPVSIGQTFALTKFRPIGFAVPGDVLLKVVEGNYNCDLSSSKTEGLVYTSNVNDTLQRLRCVGDNCTSYFTGEQFVEFIIRQMPQSGVARVCACQSSDAGQCTSSFRVLGLSLQQRANWKLQTAFPVQYSLFPTRTYVQRDDATDVLTIWYAGSSADNCNAFRTSASDARIAFVLADVGKQLNATSRYECPQSPTTLQRYRWASITEVAALGSIFEGNGQSQLVYPADVCGPIAGSRSAFIFSDTAQQGLYISAGDSERDSLHGGNVMLNDPAGLVCILDDPTANCTNLCSPEEGCPSVTYTFKPPESHVPEGETQELVMRLVLGATNDSPQLEGYVGEPRSSNDIALVQGTSNIMLSLLNEPASWVTVSVSEPTKPQYVTWDNTKTFVFGGLANTSWDYSKLGPDAGPFDIEKALEIVCVDDVSWDVEDRLPLELTLTSSVKSYNSKIILEFHKYADDYLEVPADRLEIPAVEPIIETPPPEPDLGSGESCVRGGAEWAVPGQPQSLNYDQGEILFCGYGIKQVAAGGYHSCAVSLTNYMICWGRNDYYQNVVPDDIQTTVETIGLGGYHTCATYDDGQARCWGDNGQQQATVPVISGQWASITAGAVHTCGLQNDGNVLCWGDSKYGQTDVPQGIQFESISAGYFHTCGVTVGNGQMVCWGAGKNSQQYNFGQTQAPSSVSNWSFVSSGNLHSCGIGGLINSTLVCWGSNSHGQLTPPALDDGIFWTDVSAGLLHTCGVASNQKAYCWGSSALNRLWVLPRATPSANILWRSVSAGNEHTCGLLESGRISCWGFNSAGQLAVSTAPFVRFEENGVNSDAEPGVDGLRQTGNKTTYVRDVAVRLFVPFPPETTIFTSTETDGSHPSNLLAASGRTRFDVSVNLSTFADSPNDPELAPGPISTKEYEVVVAPPAITLLHESNVLFTTNATITVDTLEGSLNPTEIRYTVDDSDPGVGDLLYVPGSPVVLNSATGNLTGYSTIKVRAFRAGATPSLIAVKSVLISASYVVFEHGGITESVLSNVETVVVNRSALTLSLQTEGDSNIFVKVCAPSTCDSHPDISLVNYSAYTGPFDLTETGTIVSVKATEAGLADGQETVKQFVMKASQPELSPNPFNLNGYLAPLQVTVTCNPGTFVRYTLDEDDEIVVQDDTASFTLLVTRNVSSRCVRSGFLSSNSLIRTFTVSDVAFTSASISESSNVAGTPNDITIRVSTTQVVTQGSQLTVTGLTGSGTPFDSNMAISNPYLAASWSQEVLTVSVVENLPQQDVLFAVTNASSCAERLPFGPVRLTSNTTDAYFSTYDRDVMHGEWIQQFFLGGSTTPIMTIKYTFATLPQTLKERMISLSSTGQHVKWTVTYGSMAPEEFEGVYRFSSTAGFTFAHPWTETGNQFSSDDGAWGALNPTSALDTLDGGSAFPEGRFWGQGVFNSGDVVVGACGTLYLGQNPAIQDSTLTSRLFLSKLYSDLSFSVNLFNPLMPQAPVSAQVSLSGTFCTGCASTTVPPFTANGTVLGAQVNFSMINGQISLEPGASGAASASNMMSISFQTNLPFPESGTGTLVQGLETISQITITGLTGSGTVSTPNLQIGAGGNSFFSSTSTFTCSGYQECLTMIGNYRPDAATISAATITLRLSCSDFNAADEYLEGLYLDEVAIPTQQQGWPGCEGACSEMKVVLSDYSLAQHASLWNKVQNGQGFNIRLKASPAVNSHSCSDVAEEYVHANVELSVRYFHTGEWNQQQGKLVYQIRNSNQRQPCEDQSWRDSANFACSDYVRYNWCSSDGLRCGGTSGSGSDWTCEEFAAGGQSAKQACCACGGGSKYWTTLSFALANGAAPQRAVLPNVTLSVDLRDGANLVSNPGFGSKLVLSNTAPGVLGVCADGELQCLTDPSPSSRRLMQIADVKQGGRRLLSAHSRSEVELNLAWSGTHKEWLYSCCWDDLKLILAKALSDNVGSIDYRYDVSVSFSSTTNQGAQAHATLFVEDDATAVYVANQLKSATIRAALSAQRVDLDVSLVGGARAYNSTNGEISLDYVEQVGNVTIGKRYEANAAVFPVETLSSFSQRWDVSHLLLEDTVAASSSGVVLFNRTVMERACEGYRIVFFTDTGITAVSRPFSVKSAEASQLQVSPVPSFTSFPCSCSNSPGCDVCECLPQSTECTSARASVVAGLYFAVTASVLDRFGNIVLEGHNGDKILASIFNGTSEDSVFGTSGNDNKLEAGNVTLSLRILKTADSVRLLYTLQGTSITDLSKPFNVLAGPLARLELQAPALQNSLRSGEIISPPPAVFLFDILNNSIPYNLSVSASLLYSPGVLLADKLDYGAQNGRAIFPEARIEKAGTYIFTATSDAIKTFSSPFTVAAADIDPINGEGEIEFVVQPSGVIADEVFSVQPVLRIRDVYGNIAEEFTGFAGVIVPNSSVTGTNTSLEFTSGIAHFTNLAISEKGIWRLTFTVGNRINVTSDEFEVHPRLHSLVVLQQPSDTAELSCMDPAPQIMLLDEDGNPSDFSRQEVSVALSQNAFRYSNFPSCGTGGCTASSTFRFFIPEGGTLVSAFLDVQVAMTDFNDDNEQVDLISVNGLPVMISCNPGEAQQCNNYFACMNSFDVTELADGNILTVAISISAAVNEWCYPRLKARVDFYGSYRPAIPETYSTDQDGNVLPIIGSRQLVATGRTLAFHKLSFPAQGLSYRMHFSTPTGVSVETEPFDILSVASNLAVIWPAEARHVIAGEAFVSQPIVRFLDSRGKLVTSMTSSVEASIESAQTLNGVEVSGVSLVGNLRLSAAGGQVTFTDLAVDNQVDLLTLVFTEVCTGTNCANLDPVLSDSVEVDPEATRLSIGWSVPAVIPAGSPISGPPTVSLLDDSGAPSPFSTKRIGVSALDSAGNESQVLGNTISTATAGFTSFSNVFMDRVGTFSLKFSYYPFTTGTSDAVSQSFQVVAGPAAKIYSDPQPSIQPFTGSPFDITVQLQDQYGNDVVSHDLTYAVAEAQNADLYSGLNTNAFLANCAGASGFACAQFLSGVATLSLRFEDIVVVNLTISATFSPSGNCSALPANSQSDCNHPLATSSSSGARTFCQQRQNTLLGDCAAIPFCGLVSGGTCLGACQCTGNVKTANENCRPCFVSTYVSVVSQPNPNAGYLQVGMVEEPGNTADGVPFTTPPKVLIQQCLQSCFPVSGLVTVSVANSDAAVTLGGTLDVSANSNGIATFGDLYVNGIATSVQLLFTSGNASTQSSNFQVGSQNNIPPTLVLPSPGLCEDFSVANGEPVKFYVVQGTKFFLEIKAKDDNQNPYDDIAIDIDHGALPGYFTENVYDTSNVETSNYSYVCGGATGLGTRTQPRKNIVSRYYVWSPVTWFPPFSFKYFSQEAGISAARTCTVTVAVEVCHRPSFTVSNEPAIVGLVSAPVVVRISASDLNDEDIVTIEQVATDSGVPGDYHIGPEEYEQVLGVDGLTRVYKNRVSRSLTLTMPSHSSSSYKVCFRARDNAYACSATGLVGEDELCISCALDPSELTGSCQSEMRSSSLYQRSHVSVCGDGRATVDESCDDGNQVSNDGCSSLCELETGFQLMGDTSRPVPICGDGLVMQGEDCDDMNTVSGDGCFQCQAELGYECGFDDISRQFFCCFPKCGDNIIIPPETCDDGNVISGDGCDSQCRSEPGFDCPGGICSANCGDGFVKGAEQCDDQNTNWGDGCSAVCTIEAGFTCGNSSAESFCLPIYGDGKRVWASEAGIAVGKGEECDDGNTAAGDGCYEGSVETGYFCCPISTYPDSCGCPFGTYPETCTDTSAIVVTINGTRSIYTGPFDAYGVDECSELCGDGMVITPIPGVCDDANWIDGDGCSGCVVEEGWQCPPGGIMQGPCTPLCGDGLLVSYEGCDDGNLADNDGCSSTCTIETGFQCGDDGCTTFCGDGHRVFPEECDDNNTASGDGCSALCTVEDGWYCVASTAETYDVCSGLCGDGIRILAEAAGEECDDGAWSRSSGDGCTDSCAIEAGFTCDVDSAGRLVGGRCSPVCGDGLWVLGEGCDDGNLVNGDGCDSSCEEEDGWTCSSSGGQGLSPPLVTDQSICMSICPDGLVVGLEQCDDGNSIAGDGCSPSCTIEPGFVCQDANGLQQPCAAFCGDGVVVGKEFCDDKNQVDGDGCSNCLVEPGWECIPANCTGVLPGERCDVFGDGQVVDNLVLGVGSVCEACPPSRLSEVRCSNPPCVPAELTQRCEGWRLYDDGGWVRVDDRSNTVTGTCRESWSRDGYCDPVNNNQICGWDGGDCCSSTCSCGNTCYNGEDGGCGSFAGGAGEYHCLDPSSDEANLFISVNGTQSTNDGQTVFIGTAVISLMSTSPGAEIYYTLDGTQPALELAGERVIDGQLYTGPFEATTSVEIKASAVLPGLRVNTIPSSVALKVARPVIFPPSTTSGQLLPSPISVQLTSSTPDATIFYSLDAGNSLQPYSAPFLVYNSRTVLAVARKDGLIESDYVNASYTLIVAPPVITPGDAESFQDSVNISITSASVQARIVWSICNATEWTDLVNKTVGEVIMTSSDDCYPNCIGVCRGGSNDGVTCADQNDIFTCRGEGATCAVEYRLVNLCNPLEWPRGAKAYTGSFTINSTYFGTNTLIAAAATQEGLASSPVVTATYTVIASTPAIVVADGMERESFPVSAGYFVAPAQVTFAHPAPGAIILFTHDGSEPSMEHNAENTRTYIVGSETVVLINVTSIVRATVSAGLLLPSGVTSTEINVQLSAPQIFASAFTQDFLTFTQLERPFLHPGIGVRTAAQHFWRNGDIDVNVTAFVSHNMLDQEELTIMYRILDGVDVELQPGMLDGTDSGVYFNQSADDRTPSQLLASGWKEYTDQDTFALNTRSTIETVAFLTGVKRSFSSRTPVYIRTRCARGHTSSDGLEPCTPCPEDSYKEPCTFEWGCQCGTCNPGTGTVSAGSEGSVSCQPLCQIGTYSSTGLDTQNVGGSPCLPCPLATYMDSEKAQECTRCPAGTTTVQEGSTEMFQCIGSAALSTGGFHTCGVVSVSGQGSCWGYDVFGQTKVPVMFSGEAYNWLSIDAGSFHTCGVTVLGEALCWGQAFKGKTSPPQISAVETWASVYTSKGYHHTCGRTNLRKAYCWGDSEYNQTVVPGVCRNVGPALAGVQCNYDRDCGELPAYCDHDQNWQSLSPGQFHTCGILVSGVGYCWGDNTYGQSDVPSDTQRWREVSAGHYHTCGVTESGQGRCWGSNVYGATNVPAEVSVWSSISSGRFHSCGITDEGALRCWGSSQDGATSPPPLPSGSRSWNSITSGLFHSCAVDDTGKGKCWGRDIYGMLDVPDATIWRQ